LINIEKFPKAVYDALNSRVWLAQKGQCPLRVLAVWKRGHSAERKTNFCVFYSPHDHRP